MMFLGTRQHQCVDLRHYQGDIQCSSTIATDVQDQDQKD